MITGVSIDRHDGAGVPRARGRAGRARRVPRRAGAGPRARATTSASGSRRSSRSRRARPTSRKSLGFDLPSETAWARIEPTGDRRHPDVAGQPRPGPRDDAGAGRGRRDGRAAGAGAHRVGFERQHAVQHDVDGRLALGDHGRRRGEDGARVRSRSKVLQIAAQHARSQRRRPRDRRRLDQRAGHAGQGGRPSPTSPGMAWFAPSSLPDGMTQGLEASVDFKVPPEGGWVSACHVCWVEIDVETGRIDDPALPRRRRLRRADQPGDRRRPDPRRRHPGHRVGAAREAHLRRRRPVAHVVAHRLPRARRPCDLPVIDIEHLHSPPHHEVNSRGVGEGGLLGAPAAVLNAVADALAPLGVVDHRDPPTAATRPRTDRIAKPAAPDSIRSGSQTSHICATFDCQNEHEVRRRGRRRW